MKKNAKRFASLLLVLAMVLSLVAVSVSGASLDLAEIAANEDENLGLSYEVQDVISLAEDQHHELKIDIIGKSPELINQAIATGNIALSLDRNTDRPYVDSTLFPKAIAGGSMADSTIWATQNKTPLFTNFKMQAASENGKTVLNVSFDSNCYFYSRSGVDYSAPHSSGGAYLDMCGWFTLNVLIGSYANNGSTEIKITPYDAFHTMPEIYTEIGEIVELANQNGLFAVEQSMGFSSAGRDMPYMIIADSKDSVDAWLELTAKAEADPASVLASIEKGELDDIRVPILYSNVHSNEVAASDGIMQFAWALARAGIDGKFSYNELTGFTDEGKAQLEKEMNNPARCYADYEGIGTGVAVPDLIKDTATYLGYLQDGNGKSGKVDLDKYYTQQVNEVAVKDLLKGVFYILVPEENVDGRTYITRAASNGYDLNRDNSFQTTPETANMQYLIGTYNPVSFTEFHGRVTDFQCEPCDPPHEPNFEYDLLAKHLLTGGEAFGIAAVANNDGYNSYVMPQRDYLSYIDEEHTRTQWFEPWDDMSTSYTPQFAMLHGTVAYTVELPAYCDDTAQAVCYGMIGQSDYIKGEKLGYLNAQVSIFERGVTNANSDAYEKVGQWLCDQYDVEGAEMEIFRPEYDGEGENGNFYPECYIIPLSGGVQKNVQAAADMMVWLARNHVKLNLLTKPITYDGVLCPAGSVVVSMYQAKRSVANGALYDGTLINGWPALYSEGITTFNETRGFDMVTVTKPAAYAEIAAALSEDMDYEAAIDYSENMKGYFVGVRGGDVVILNDSEDAVAAVNELLQAGKKVGMVETYSNYAGSFICSYEDYLSVADSYTLSAIGPGFEEHAKLIRKAPVVYLTGVPAATTSGGCIANSQVGNSSWNYDRVAMENLNFQVTENVEEADVFAGASSLSGDALNSVLAGKPYIGYGSTALRGNITRTITGIERTGLSGAMDCLAYVTYPNLSNINSSFINNDDDVMYGYGLGYFSAIPKGAVALVAVDGSRMPTEGFIPATDESTKAAFEKFLDGGILGFSYEKDGLNVALFANTLTQKGHQKDEYKYVSNFIFSSMLSDEEFENHVPHAENYEQEFETFSDVSEKDWFFGEVNMATSKYNVGHTPVLFAGHQFPRGVRVDALMNGMGGGVFAPNKGTTRGMIVTVLYRFAGEPTPSVENPFADVKEGMYYEDAVRWAYEYGIVTGKTATKFAPEDPITREQMAAILYRYATYYASDAVDPVDELTFSDTNKISSYAVDAIKWCVGNGLINGVGNNRLAPQEGSTRAQIAALIVRMNGLWTK